MSHYTHFLNYLRGLSDAELLHEASLRATGTGHADSPRFSVACLVAAEAARRDRLMAGGELGAGGSGVWGKEGMGLEAEVRRRLAERKTVVD